MSLDASQYEVFVPAEQKWNLPIDHWSPSSLAMLHRCPRQWQARYLHGRKERPAESLLVGSAVHATIERNFRQKIESHEDLAVASLLDWYTDEGFLSEVAEREAIAGEETYWDTDPEQAMLRGHKMIAAYQGQVAERIQPIEVETAISVDLGLPVPIEGRFDVRREFSTIDIKTGRSANRKPKEDWRIQAAVYGKATGQPVEFHSVTATLKDGKVTIVTPLESEELLVAPTPAEQEELSRSLKTLSALGCLYMELYGPDEPWPTLGRFHQWACSYCGYRKDCPAWS